MNTDRFFTTPTFFHLNTHTTMANETTGVFSDLFIAFGTLAQNLADTLGSGVTTATSVVQTCLDLCATIVTTMANTAIQLIQGVSTAVTSAISPKK